MTTEPKEQQKAMLTEALKTSAQLDTFASVEEVQEIRTARRTSPNGSKFNKTARTLAILGLVAAVGTASLHFRNSAETLAPLGSAPSVAVSAPIERELEARLGFLGQFSAVEQVELRAQVGGTLNEIHFKDGDIVQKGDLLFSVDPTPYEIKLSHATAQLENAYARLELANRELARAKMLKSSDAGTSQNVDQRQAEQRAAQATVDEAKAQIRDAKFDLDHTGIVAPFTGRVGTHQVSAGNLIAGSRAGGDSSTLLTTIVSMDPIYLNFDMSEADYMAFSRQRADKQAAVTNKVNISLSDEKNFEREGTLTFVDNMIDRSSGTIRARATIPNKDLLLTPGGFARVRVALSTPEKVLLVPDSSVLPDQASHVVLTVNENNVVTSKAVERGDLRGGLRVIRAGLATTDKVVIDGIPTTSPGSKVTPTTGAIQFKSEQD